MDTLKSVSFDPKKIILKDNRVESAIIPLHSADLGRDVVVSGACVIEGAVFAQNLEIRNGPLEVQGAVYAQGDISIHSEVNAGILFQKAVGCAGKVTSLSDRTNPIFRSDLYGRKVILRHALIAANIFADEVDLDDCVVVGGVFATKRFASKDSLVGTFNSPEVMLSGRLVLLLPACFSTEPPQASGDLQIVNLALADLASLYFGAPEKPRTGAIQLDPHVDTIETELTDQQGNKMKVMALTVAGRVLLAGLSDLEGLGNQYLAAAVGLGPHLLKRFSLERGEVDPEKVASFFFDVLHGKVQFKKLDDSIPMEEIRRTYG